MLRVKIFLLLTILPIKGNFLLESEHKENDTLSVEETAKNYNVETEILLKRSIDGRYARNTIQLTKKKKLRYHKKSGNQKKSLINRLKYVFHDQTGEFVNTSILRLHGDFLPSNKTLFRKKDLTKNEIQLVHKSNESSLAKFFKDQSVQSQKKDLKTKGDKFVFNNITMDLDDTDLLRFYGGRVLRRKLVPDDDLQDYEKSSIDRTGTMSKEGSSALKRDESSSKLGEKEADRNNSLMIGSIVYKSNEIPSSKLLEAGMGQKRFQAPNDEMAYLFHGKTSSKTNSAKNGTEYLLGILKESEAEEIGKEKRQLFGREGANFQNLTLRDIRKRFEDIVANISREIKEASFSDSKGVLNKIKNELNGNNSTLHETHDDLEKKKILNEIDKRGSENKPLSRKRHFIEAKHAGDLIVTKGSSNRGPGQLLYNVEVGPGYQDGLQENYDNKDGSFTEQNHDEKHNLQNRTLRFENGIVDSEEERTKEENDRSELQITNEDSEENDDDASKKDFVAVLPGKLGLRNKMKGWSDSIEPNVNREIENENEKKEVIQALLGIPEKGKKRSQREDPIMELLSTKDKRESKTKKTVLEKISRNARKNEKEFEEKIVLREIQNVHKKTKREKEPEKEVVTADEREMLNLISSEDRKDGTVDVRHSINKYPHSQELRHLNSVIRDALDKFTRLTENDTKGGDIRIGSNNVKPSKHKTSNLTKIHNSLSKGPDLIIPSLIQLKKDPKHVNVTNLMHELVDTVDVKDRKKTNKTRLTEAKIDDEINKKPLTEAKNDDETNNDAGPTKAKNDHDQTNKTPLTEAKSDDDGYGISPMPLMEAKNDIDLSDTNKTDSKEGKKIDENEPLTEAKNEVDLIDVTKVDPQGGKNDVEEPLTEAKNEVDISETNQEKPIESIMENVRLETTKEPLTEAKNEIDLSDINKADPQVDKMNNDIKEPLTEAKNEVDVSETNKATPTEAKIDENPCEINKTSLIEAKNDDVSIHSIQGKLDALLKSGLLNDDKSLNSSCALNRTIYNDTAINPKIMNGGFSEKTDKKRNESRKDFHEFSKSHDIGRIDTTEKESGAGSGDEPDYDYLFNSPLYGKGISIKAENITEHPETTHAQNVEVASFKKPKNRIKRKLLGCIENCLS